MVRSSSRTARSRIRSGTSASPSPTTRPSGPRSASTATWRCSASTASPMASTRGSAACPRSVWVASRSRGPRSTDMGRELIAVLDLGSQYAQLIARRVRECRVYCEVLPHATRRADLADRNVKGVILSGGPASVYEPGAPQVDPDLLDGGLPVLGICY